MEQTKENKMGTEPVLRLIISNVVDSYFVSKVSMDALTAVSLSFPIQQLIIAMAVGTGVGVNSLVSRRLGEKRRQEADKAASHGVVLAALTSLLFAVFGLFFAEKFISLFTESAGVTALGGQYLSVVSLCSFGVFIEIALEKTLQATGNMIYPMQFMLVGCITNLILDPILIFGLLGFPAMGVLGAAIATVAGEILSMLYSVYIIFCKKHEVRVSLKGFRFDKTTLRDIYAVAAPSMLMQSIGSFLVMGLNQILSAFSETAVAVPRPAASWPWERCCFGWRRPSSCPSLMKLGKCWPSACPPSARSACVLYRRLSVFSFPPCFRRWGRANTACLSLCCASWR